MFSFWNVDIDFMTGSITKFIMFSFSFNLLQILKVVDLICRLTLWEVNTMKKLSLQIKSWKLTLGWLIMIK